MNKAFFSILCCSTALLFSDSCNPCKTVCEPCPDFEPCPPPSNCAYNAPHGIDLLCDWNVFATASFLYWEAKEDNLELGAIIVEDDVAGTVITNEDITIVGMDFEYNPGFKVGLGYNFNFDNWQIYAEYTYHHSTTTASIDSIPKETGGINNSNLAVFWKSSLVNDTDLAEFEPDRASSKWKMHLDMADFELAREYYVGRCLTFRTFGGLRAAWIRQTYNVEYEELFTSGNFENQVNEILTASHKTKSWGIGPRVGSDIHWLFCNNFRIFIDTSVSILFTKYTTASICSLFEDYSSNDLSLNDEVNTKTKRNTDPCFLRPTAEISLGLGWGDYFFCNKWYFDIEIGYTTSVFWNQNMFVNMLTNNNNNKFEIFNKGGDLYFHGLTVTAKIDF